MKEVVITGYLRTAFSRSRPKDPGKDVFGAVRAEELLAKLAPELIKRTGLAPEEIDDFIVACATAVGEQWTYGGRFPLFLANLPETIPAKFVDQQCGSSMAGIHIGFMEIATGNADTVLVGGMEHMTRIPMGGASVQAGLLAPNPKFFTNPEYHHWDMMTSLNMGFTAQKLLEQTDVTRSEMDEWALRSHKLAAQAQAEGFFKDEIMPLDVEQVDGAVKTVDSDQSVRPGTTIEELSALKPAFKEGHQITAGNSSPLNAGATAMILMSKEKAEEKGLKPLATLRSIGVAGVHPSIMGAGPVPASKKALANAGLAVTDIDFWEINEAFAIVTLHCIRELGIDPRRVNVMGGAIAIGHALGATGVRLVGTLARILSLKGGRYGCATACVGGGQGVATIIEREAR
ncbi:MAG: acetyl-CoA C-acetyltransferase [Desulfomonilaceae bacterium]